MHAWQYGGLIGKMDKEAKIGDIWRQLHVSPGRLMRKRGKLSVWQLNREDKRRELMILRGFRVLSKVKRLDNRAYKRLWDDRVHLLKAFDDTLVQDRSISGFPSMTFFLSMHRCPRSRQMLQHMESRKWLTTGLKTILARLAHHWID